MMELNGIVFNVAPSDAVDQRSRSESGASSIFSTDSISSALSAVSGAGSETSVTSQETCVNIGHRTDIPPELNLQSSPAADGVIPRIESERAIPEGSVLSPERKKKAFFVEKVDEDQFRADQAVFSSQDLPLIRPKPEQVEEPSPLRARKNSLTKRKKSTGESPNVRRKNSSTQRKTSIEKGSNQSPPGQQKSGHKLSADGSISLSTGRKKNSKDETHKVRNDSTEGAEEGEHDQLLELPKIRKNRKNKLGNRRVSYDDHVVKIPTDDTPDENDDVFEEKQDEMYNEEEDAVIIPRLKKRRPLFHPHERNVKILLIILFLVIVGGVTCIWIFYKRQLYLVEIGRKITFNEDTRTLLVREDGTENVALRGVLGLTVPNVLPYLCSEEHHMTELCLRWPGIAVLNINYWDATDDISCYNISWNKISDSFIPRDCYSLNNANWYGGGLVREQLWPLEKQEVAEMPYVTGNILDGEYGSIVQSYWLSSQGIALVVPTNMPLWVGINASSNGLCLSAVYKGPYRQLSETIGSNLHYRMCKGPNFKSLHKFMTAETVESLSHEPDDDLLRYPGWSTWGKFGMNVTQENVAALYREIKENKFPANHLEIYYKWEPNYGDLYFDRNKFPNLQQLVSELQQNDVEVMVCVHPFVDSRSEIFQVGVREGYFIMNEDDVVPGLTYWWNRVGAVVDFTSSRSITWFRSRLHALQNQTGISSLRFDTGEVSWLPHKPHFSIPQINPLKYTQMYVAFAESFRQRAIVTSSFLNQDMSVMIRIHDRSPTWGYGNGLKSIIPTVLTLNLLGYPYLQLQVGGGGDNLQGVKNISFADSFPSRELYLRTLQIAMFLPSFQFSVLPWQYDAEMTKLAQQYVKFHGDFVVPQIKSVIANSTSKHLPVIRPMWWIDDSDISRTIDSQFLIGNKVLVAPVLEKGKLKRDIYLPAGSWHDRFKGMIIEGGTWIKDYSVPMNIVPYFVHA